VLRRVVGTSRSEKIEFASPLASKWGTLYLPCSVGMRGSSSGTHRRVSSRVDQTTCFTPASFAALAIARACASSLSGERWSQKKVTQYAPWAPANAFFRLSTSSTSAATTSAPSFASSFAFAPFGSRVSARAANPPLGSARMARMRPPPCAPVAPTTAIVFLLTGPSSSGKREHAAPREASGFLPGSLGLFGLSG
jgi:hypothetical protein